MHMASSSIPALTAAVTSPPLAVLRPYDLNASYVSYSDAQTAVIGTKEGVFNPRARISVEISAEKVEPGKTFVNLRFCYSNRYIGRNDDDGVIPVAQVKQPDTTSTLFELRQHDVTDNVYYFCHVQSQQFLMINEALDTLEINDWTDDPRIYFEVVDWDSLVKLPSVAAFTCDNYNYLSPCSYAGHQYLKFASYDYNDQGAAHEVEQLSDGSVKIKCLSLSSSWKNSGSWIWADSFDASTTDPSLIFWVVKSPVDVNSAIALCSALNNQFCKRVPSEDGIEDCLAAATPAIDDFAKMWVQELVSDRTISKVTYRLDDARIYDVKSYISASTTAVNETGAEAYIPVKISYTTTVSYCFSNSAPLGTYVFPIIDAHLLLISKGGSIETTTHEISEWLVWGETTSTKKNSSVSGKVLVQPYTRATVNFVGTLGTYDVPFNYQQKDTSSIDQQVTYTDKDDGIYTGANVYDLILKVVSSEPL